MIADLTDLAVSLDKGGDAALDLDSLAVKLAGLSAEVEAYRESLIRHIQARCDLLGKPAVLGVDNMTIQQLLDTRDALDREFRERYRIKEDLFQPRLSTTPEIDRHTAFTSGR